MRAQAAHALNRNDLALALVLLWQFAANERSLPQYDAMRHQKTFGMRNLNEWAVLGRCWVLGICDA
jgi:hypothetical protein